MTATDRLSLTSRMINGLLAVEPLAKFAKTRARNMMIQRAEAMGVPWRQRFAELRSRGQSLDFDPQWEVELAALQNAQLTYPEYYVAPFHAYDEGNLGWRPAMEVEVAAYAVHARIWPELGPQGDAHLRQSYHTVLLEQLPEAPERIVDVGCGVGMSTQTLHATFPQAEVTGVDLSPHFLTVARYREAQSALAGAAPITWHHAPAEATGLPTAAYDLVSVCLVFHELPQAPAQTILQEARRLLRPGGHLAIMDMNPQSEVFAAMPPFVFTLLKSTEPYLDDYLSLDLEAAIQAAGFAPPGVTCNSPRHRTVIAQAI